MLGTDSLSCHSAFSPSISRKKKKTSSLKQDEGEYFHYWDSWVHQTLTTAALNMFEKFASLFELAKQI